MIEPTTVALGSGAQKAIEKSTAAFVERISLKFIKDKYDEVRLLLDRGLPKYLEANYAKCETLKTLLNRNDPISIEECFVAPDFQIQGKVVTSDSLLNRINASGGNVIITGLAGSGKSVFLKYAFKQVLEKGHTYYPIFFELRNLNRADSKKKLLLSKIYDSVHECCNSFTRAQFNYGMKIGAFYLLLDGFDELNQEIRDQVSNEINELARNNGSCAVVVTSRPSDEFISWEGFTEATLLPFDLEKVEEYISKLSFDEEKKTDFLVDLREGVFDSNQDFLSNPLLCAMMLLTYDSFGEIPEKRHIFYSKCFDVLAREHDASKGRYKRELFSDLTMEQIEKTFMFFCALSYVERTISFNDTQMVNFVREAISSCGFNASVENVIRDFRESISIMERVGLFYEYAHRSFQEYFYAKFVVSDRKLSLIEKLDWLVVGFGFGFDDTIEMIADMDRAYYEDEFLLPKIQNLNKKFSKVIPQINPSGILSTFFSSIQSSTDAVGSIVGEKPTKYYIQGNRDSLFLMGQALRKYSDQYADELKKNSVEEKLQIEEALEILDQEFGGEIKIHHSNNVRLIKIEAHCFASRLKQAVFCLCSHLEEKQEKRKQGLGALIKRKYS